jgi:DNA-directed RNA polymerase subunit M/transcription elongation factor TFIIS
MFCKTCGSLLVPRKTEFGKWMSCPNGHAQPETVTSAQTHVSQNTNQGKKIQAIEDERPLAVYDHICKKCGHNKAELIEIQPSYSDEDSTMRMKCGKCSFVEQLDGKTR